MSDCATRTSILFSLLFISSFGFANHFGAKAQGSCILTVYKYEMLLAGWDMERIEVDKLSPRNLSNFHKVNEQVLGKVNQICKGGPFGPCFEYAFKQYQEIYPGRKTADLWEMSKGLCKQQIADVNCMKIFRPYLEKTLPDPSPRIVLEKSADHCQYFKFGGCISFVLDKELNVLRHSEKVAYNSAQTICHGVVFPDCMQNSYNLYMQGQKMLTQKRWDEIAWMCRR